MQVGHGILGIVFGSAAQTAKQLIFSVLVKKERNVSGVHVIKSFNGSSTPSYHAI